MNTRTQYAHLAVAETLVVEGLGSLAQTLHAVLGGGEATGHVQLDMTRTSSLGNDALVESLHACALLYDCIQLSHKGDLLGTVGGSNLMLQNGNGHVARVHRIKIGVGEGCTHAVHGMVATLEIADRL